MDKNLKNKDNEDSHEEEIEKIEKPSYTYWKRETDKPFSNEFKPTKSDSNVNEISTPITNVYGSAWNKAGTWEEKHMNKSQFEDFFSQSLKNKKINFKDSFTIDGISSYTGDTYYVFVRGKMKFVYDCEFNLNIRGLNDFDGVKGDIKVKEVHNHDLDDEFEFDYSGKFDGDSDKANVIMSIVKGHQSQIQKIIRTMFDELKESCLQIGNSQNTQQTNTNLI